ncbi:hypothetical protein HELRODRAFT_166079 [Helobdella robusta]|uniref:C-type lectin domain-containing protein n=1 Tax=Helobdella robusta TaxID=6412 RepID=T1EXQ1_HELRO|nr:hypothetical protein HELRODRAFT_166079 [Helobdella robusta]ESN90413.1 hypothetical protein HELRODRAFT_166079 [Helobdella robusta]
MQRHLNCKSLTIVRHSGLAGNVGREFDGDDGWVIYYAPTTTTLAYNTITDGTHNKIKNSNINRNNVSDAITTNDHKNDNGGKVDHNKNNDNNINPDNAEDGRDKYKKMKKEKKISKYKNFEIAMTFENAQGHCKNLGGHLAHIQTIREQVFVEDYLRHRLERINRDALATNVGYWIGGRRARGSHGATCMYDQWKWVDVHNREMGTISGFTAFAKGRPDKLVFHVMGFGCCGVET